MTALGCAAALAVALTVTAAAPLADPGVQLARLPDGRHLAFRCAGSGTPTVLLEGGWAASSLAWSKVERLVAPVTRVCSYDRAGLGLSDGRPAPRDGTAIARDLDEGLRALKIAGPFVVAGHSAGGLYVRVFADRRPGDVVGMVLVDPSVEYQDKRLSAVFGPGAGSTAGIRNRAAACLAAAKAHALPSPDPKLVRCAAATPIATWETQVAELDSLWGATSDEVAGGRSSYGALPLIVLTAGDTNAALPDPSRRVADRVWAGLHQELAEHSTIGVRRTVDRTGHLIPKDRPDAVADAIIEVVKAARGEPLGTPRPIG
ncbi:alpha/beta hydrolase [Polymorphobacter sp. PAMC 29334]|uniref:alpha/beta fold hydrolase n=1 Tax=Polymorphobacter sp. PAMC 29334 TaxID=2862331 RepID=UPI001C662F61|nr:alpha/beta hydrolase [Polymorphobacter sp. PAMC 29334]QYE34509.1 alpha/beta hydrolase [Polymorphobacter sp. PAMC 29334]